MVTERNSALGEIGSVAALLLQAKREALFYLFHALVADDPLFDWTVDIGIDFSFGELFGKGPHDFHERGRADFKFTTIQPNRSHAVKIHVDGTNHGPNRTRAVGDVAWSQPWFCTAAYLGGPLVLIPWACSV